MEVEETGCKGVVDGQCNANADALGNQEKYDRTCQCFTSFSMYLDKEFQLEIFYG